jgi:hypothetical protein
MYITAVPKHHAMNAYRGRGGKEPRVVNKLLYVEVSDYVSQPSFFAPVEGFLKTIG